MAKEPTKLLFQWNFIISGLIPRQVKLKRKIWLKKGELLLDKKGDDLYVYLLGNKDSGGCNEKIITPYLWVSSLITKNAAELTSGGGSSITSEDELGTRPMLSSSMTIQIPENAVKDIEKHAHKFLSYIGWLHDKYINIINDNDFISIALDYFHDAEKKFIYSDEGFISAMISLESLFNEGPSSIKHKLSHRASFLLGLCGVASIEAFEKLKDFYNHRSKLIHGGGSASYDPDRFLVSHYTRKALIIFLILLNNESRKKLRKNVRKQAILKEIDYAMLTIDRRKVLEKEIKKGLKDFKLVVPRTFEGSGDNGDYRTTAW